VGDGVVVVVYDNRRYNTKYHLIGRFYEWVPQQRITLKTTHSVDGVPSTYLRQPPSPPGCAKLFPSRGKAGFYFGFITDFVCVRLSCTASLGAGGVYSSPPIYRQTSFYHSASTPIGSPPSGATRLLSTVLRQVRGIFFRQSTTYWHTLRRILQ